VNPIKTHNHRVLLDGLRERLHDAGYRAAADLALENGMRPDLVVQQGDRAFLIELKLHQGETRKGLDQLVRYSQFVPGEPVLAMPKDRATARTREMCDEAGVTLWLFNDDAVYRRARTYWQKPGEVSAHAAARTEILKSVAA